MNEEVYLRHAHKHEVFDKLVLSFWVCIAMRALSTPNKKFASVCSISRKTCGMKLIFLHVDKHKGFIQVDSITVGLVRHAQCTQNNKFVIYLQYLKENAKDMKLIFWLQINIKDFFKLTV